jgi:AraC-like DNA-binding protein
MSVSVHKTTSKQFTRYGFLEGTGVEVFHARFDHHRFTAHAHDTWAIGAVVRGTKDIAAKERQPQVLDAGRVYAIPPNVAHAGKCVGDRGCEYVMIYIPDDEWKTQCAIQGVSPHVLASSVRNPGLVARFAAFAAMSLERPQALSTWHGEWTLFCERMLGALHPNDATTRLPSAVAPDRRLLRARDFMRTFPHRNVTLDELAREASLSVPEFCRRFAAAFGLSPHRYHLVLRLVDAKRLLMRGMAPSEAAVATGFADQSHMGRHFKSMFGMTPSAVAMRNSARTF